MTSSPKGILQEVFRNKDKVSGQKDQKRLTEIPKSRIPTSVPAYPASPN